VSDVSIRDLRNHGGEIVERATRGESITITRSGKVVARLEAACPAPLSAATLLERWRHLPPIDASALRADIDAVLDASV
jgi:antitoxin (DNA-binding transcriptional repressor) of toxin-antitoxin stability system